MSIPTVQPPANPPAPRRSAWERWMIIWHAVFYLTLALPTVLALFSRNLRPGPLASPWLVLGLSLALGSWYGLVILWLLPRLQAKQQAAWSLVFLAGALALWLPLVRAHPAYYLVASSFYGLMWGVLPFGLAVVGNILLTGLILWSQAPYLGKPAAPPPSLLVIGAIVVGWSILMALWIRTIMRESSERKRLIEQLEAAQQNLAAAERQAGILQERQRLAQEIHDTLAQGFTSIVMQLEAADLALPQAEPTVRRHIRQAQDTARASLAEARRLVLALQPAPLEGASLPEALERVAGRWAQETGIQTHFDVTGVPCPLHPEAQVTLLRAAQEALANVHKHAQANQISITLSYMEDQVALDIHDDGRGFHLEDPPRPPDQQSGGFGLRAMRERVERLGGVVIVESSPGKGTTLAVQIPLVNELR